MKVIHFFFFAYMANVSLASINEYKNNTKSPNLRQRRNQVNFTTKNDESHDNADSSTSFELLEYDIVNKSDIFEERNDVFVSQDDLHTADSSSVFELLEFDIGNKSGIIDERNIVSSPLYRPLSTSTVPVSQDEVNNFNWVNYERTRRGLQPLYWSNDCIREAQRWSKYMASISRLKHRNPLSQNLDGGWRLLAENIAYHPSMAYSGTHTMLMNSQAHRNNILNPYLNRFGIGVYKSGQYYWTTQIFKQV